MASKVQIFVTTATGRQGEVVSPATGGQAAIPININRFISGAGVGLLVNLAEGSSADYDIEVTGSPLETPDADKAWNKHDVIKNKKTSANGNLAYPVTAVRLFFRSFAGTLTFAVVLAD